MSDVFFIIIRMDVHVELALFESKNEFSNGVLLSFRRQRFEVTSQPWDEAN